MRTKGTGRGGKTAFLFLLTTVVVSFLLTNSSLFAEDTDSIATLRRMGKAFASIAEKASPAVVGIKVEREVENHQSYESPFEDPFFFDRFFRRRSPERGSRRPPPRQIAQGSGFIISPKGYILTNNHLVGDAEKVIVKLLDNRQLEAVIIGTDPGSDVAVVKIDAKNLSWLELADSDKLDVGEWVIAIGNPFGLSHTVTAGIVSAKGRSGVGITAYEDAYEDFIQTDAAINPGNSGGPLLNLDGKVVGINTAIISRSGGNMGIGMAIPVNMARNIYKQLVEGGTVVRGFLGVSMEQLTPELAGALELDEDTKGVVITEVIEGTSAEKAGLERNDVIIELDGEAVEKANDLRNRVAQLKPGTKIELVILREGRRKPIEAELGQRQKEGIVIGKRSVTLNQPGITVQNLTDDLAQRLGYEGQSGVIVTEVERSSPAELAGIRPGALIIEVDREPVKNVRQFEEAVQKAAEKGRILLLINTGRYNRLIVLKLPEK